MTARSSIGALCRIPCFTRSLFVTMQIQKHYRSLPPFYRRPLVLLAGLLLVIGACAVVYAQHQQTEQAAIIKPPQTFPALPAEQKLYTLSLDGLAASRELYKLGDAYTTKLVSRLVKSAQKAAAQPLHTVMDKTQTPPSGDKHDYMSLAIYWWPDPDSPNGQPYIRKDGKVNPETKQVSDKDYFNTMLDTTNKLALAYYFTADETYARQAADQLRAWFISPQTRMNPNLNFAQIIKGKDSDGTGLIDLRYVPQILDYQALIAPAKVLTTDETKTLHDWFADYADWLIHSDPGKDQSDSENNHGTWYDAQIIAISSYLGKKDQAVDYAKRVQDLIETQIAADGTQPYELARTNSWDYSILNLDGMLQAGLAARTVDVDVLGYRNKQGASISTAVSLLAPYAKGEKSWPYKQISGFDKAKIANVLPVARLLLKNDFGLSAEQTLALDPDDTVQVAFAVR